MKNLLLKIHKPINYVILFIVLSTAFFSLPWRMPTALMATDSGEVELTLKRTNGEEIQKRVVFEDKNNAEYLFFQEFISFKNINNPKLNIVDMSDRTIYRWSPKIVFSVALTSAILCAFFYYLFSLFATAGQSYPFFVHLGILSISLIALLPGMYNFDTYYILKELGEFRTSEFPGLYYHSIMTVLMHANPYPWTFALFNILGLSAFLFHLYVMSEELNVKKYYWIVCAIFYFYPSNIFMSLSAGRDSISHWLFFIFSMQLYLVFVKKDFVYKKAILLGLTAGITGLFRPETDYLLIPFTLIIAFACFRQNLKWFAVLIAIVLTFTGAKKIVNMTSIGHDKKHLDIYQSTILINPLSYILKNKYETIPEDVDKKLGPFFKNDYLIKYQINEDIEPFHKGGVNYDQADFYNQFRNEAIRTILENPLLYIKNRARLARTMFNFGGDTCYLGFLFDYKHSRKEFMAIRNAFSFSEYKPVPFITSAFIKIFAVQRRLPGFIGQSYLIPFLMIIICLFLAPFRGGYYQILFLHFMRAILVIATAPAGYFKYHYALWLFGVFGVLCVIWERRLTLERKMGQNNLGD